MPVEKSVLSIQAITEAVQASVNEIPEVIDDGTQPVVGDAHWHERDEMGRNWNISFVRNGTVYIDAVKAIVEEMRLKVDVVTP
jgi:hypothetical protein